MVKEVGYTEHARAYDHYDRDKIYWPVSVSKSDDRWVEGYQVISLVLRSGPLNIDCHTGNSVLGNSSGLR